MRMKEPAPAIAGLPALTCICVFIVRDNVIRRNRIRRVGFLLIDVETAIKDVSVW